MLGALRVRRAPREGAVRHLVAVLLASLLLWSSAFGLRIVTTPGRHCPTAPVQVVRTTVRDCCGRVVSVARAPRAGERAFLQCRCEEKRAASHDATFETKGSLVEALASAPLRIEIAAPRAPLSRITPVSARVAGLATPPPVPPPTLG